MWGVAGGVLPRLLPWLRGSALRSRLESHLRYVFTTDCLIKVEGGSRHLEKRDLEKVSAVAGITISALSNCSGTPL